MTTLSRLNLCSPAITSTPVSLAGMNPNRLTGQLLTLPRAMSSQLDPSKPLTIRVGNRRLLLDHGCVSFSADGTVKILLPPVQLFGITDDDDMRLPVEPLDFRIPQPTSVIRKVHTKETSGMEKAVSSSEVSANGTGTLDCSCTVEAPMCRNLQKTEELSPTLLPAEETSEVEVPVKTVNTNDDCLLHMFRFLGIADLLRTRCVCRTWNHVSRHPSLVSLHLVTPFTFTKLSF